MTNIYNVIDTVHSMMTKIVNDPETLRLNTADVVANFRSCDFYLTRDAVLFAGNEVFTMDVFADFVKFGSMNNRNTEILHFSDYVIALREDGNWVDDLVQKYFA